MRGIGRPWELFHGIYFSPWYIRYKTLISTWTHRLILKQGVKRHFGPEWNRNNLTIEALRSLNGCTPGAYVLKSRDENDKTMYPEYNLPTRSLQNTTRKWLSSRADK